VEQKRQLQRRKKKTRRWTSRQRHLQGEKLRVQQSMHQLQSVHDVEESMHRAVIDVAELCVPFGTREGHEGREIEPWKGEVQQQE
jgi:hypothetical protein